LTKEYNPVIANVSIPTKLVVGNITEEPHTSNPEGSSETIKVRPSIPLDHIGFSNRLLSLALRDLTKKQTKTLYSNLNKISLPSLDDAIVPIKGPIKTVQVPFKEAWEQIAWAYAEKSVFAVRGLTHIHESKDKAFLQSFAAVSLKHYAWSIELFTQALNYFLVQTIANYVWQTEENEHLQENLEHKLSIEVLEQIDKYKGRP
jgi:hypothetical protein